MEIKHSIRYTHLVGAQKARYEECVMVTAIAPGNFRTVHEHLDAVWITAEDDARIVVTEYVGSDSVGRIVPRSEWDDYSDEW